MDFVASLSLTFLFAHFGFGLCAVIAHFLRADSGVRETDPGLPSGNCLPHLWINLFNALYCLCMAGFMLCGAYMGYLNLSEWGITLFSMLSFLGLGALVMFWNRICVAFDRGYEVRWDKSGMSGAANHMGYPFGPIRNRVEFDDISELIRNRKDVTGVRSQAGTKICWDGSYLNTGELCARVKVARPDLFLDC